MSDNATKIRALEEMIREARVQGALFHPTNPHDSWYCDCGVFGRGGSICWACDSLDIHYQWVPRMGGGAQTVILNDPME